MSQEAWLGGKFVSNSLLYMQVLNIKRGGTATYVCLVVEKARHSGGIFCQPADSADISNILN